MKKGLFSLFLVFVLSAAISAAACAQVNITFLNSKGEIQAQLEEIAALYNEITPNVKVEIIPCPVGQSPFEKVVSMYASGNAPTIAMVDAGDVKKFQDKALNLTSEKWVQDAIPGSLDMATLEDGTVIGFPFAVEGYGLIYNKKVLDKALGKSFDPFSIRTRKDLQALFEQLKTAGVAPLVISPLDWSLGAHFFAIAYAAQSPDPKKISEFLQDLRAGKIDLTKNNVVNGLLDTFDLMREYNIDKDDPLSGTYDRGSYLLGSGEVAMWFMGNWAWPQLSELDPEGEYGFLPVPISDNPDDYGNSQIPVGATKFLILDKEQSSEAEQKAAKDFLNWLVYDAKGQDMLVNKLSIIPAFKNITLEPKDPLAKSILQYVREGKTLKFVLDLPADHWRMVGSFMQKYLGNAAGRDELLKEIENYWKNVK